MSSSSSAEAPQALIRRLLHYARPRQLQLAVRMAELGTIQRAAESLGMSQPSATQAITRLEALLGIALFDRHARGVRLTREGALLMPSLGRTLASFDMLGRDAAHVSEGAEGLVRIAGIAAASAAVAAPALSALCAAHPDLWIDYREIDAAQIPSLCTDDGADIVLCRASVEVPEGYSFVRLRHDRLDIYCASDHPLATRRSLSARACAEATWLLPPIDSPPHRAFLDLCGQLKMTPKLARAGTRSMAVSVALVCQLKLLHVGLESHMGPYVEAGRLRRLPLALPGAVDAIGLLRKARVRAGAAETAANYLEEWARGRRASQ